MQLKKKDIHVNWVKIVSNLAQNGKKYAIIGLESKMSPFSTKCEFFIDILNFRSFRPILAHLRSKVGQNWSIKAKVVSNR